MRRVGLTAEQLMNREGKLTASAVACLMTGDDAAVLKLWRIMIGEQDDDDLTGLWPAQLGLATEELNLDWYERKRKTPVSRRGEVVVHRAKKWMAATLDGWDTVEGCPVEAKHVGGFEPLDTIIARYQPQMHWQMIVTGATKCQLSVIVAAKEPVIETIEYDGAYAAILIERATRFIEYVHTFTPPVVMPAAAPPVIPTQEVDMKGTKSGNEWGEHAATWLEHQGSRKKADDAEKELKKLVPIDAKRAFGSGVEITRNKAGSMALRKEETKS